MHAATLLTVAFSAFALAQQVDQPADEQPTEIDNPSTPFLSQTNDGGAVTGQPDPDVSQPTGDVPTLSQAPSDPAGSTLVSVPTGSVSVSGSSPAQSSPASETGDEESPSGTEGPEPTKTGGGGGAGSGPNASQTGAESGSGTEAPNASATESATGAAAIATAAPAGIGLGIAGAVFAAFL